MVVKKYNKCNQDSINKTRIKEIIKLKKREFVGLKKIKEFC
ncbi:hypothetical protein HFN_1665 [Helicobacter fennelliae MRY12-0050]|uniref:Uncharacterized protein n=1 Tax=Helicobacter fennelliae MRY12-0050 TaxID=1325130 RepID=T1DUZ0_9HELI|nr:hypothetical protein HFN_1665 [Helicobacter fennelliae MRY12-0050]